MTDRNIALDGPFNGQFIDAAQAQANDYELTEWAPGEDAYIHVPLAATEFDADGVPVEIAQEIAKLEGEDS